MKKTALYLLLLLAAGILMSSCRKKKQETTLNDNGIKTDFVWRCGLSSPLGYPMQVYKGELEGPIVEGSRTGASLDDSGIISGMDGWGEICFNDRTDERTKYKESKSKTQIPKRLRCIWYSYVEDIMYGIDTELDYPKMVKLFNEGFYDSDKRDGKVKITYDTILVGLAPGGVVVVWLENNDTQVEIGRYQAKKTVIDPKEIAKLWSEYKLLFRPAERQRTLRNPRIIPPEVREANKNKPIPYGLWDSYRIKYCWRPTFVFVSEGKLEHDVSLDFFNAEEETLLDNEVTENLYHERAIPTGLHIAWWDKTGQGYAGNIDFDEKEIFAAFKKLYKKNPEANIDLEIKINPGSTYLGISLKNGIDEIPLKKSEPEVFKASKVTERYSFNWRPVLVFPKGEKMPYKVEFLDGYTREVFPTEKEFTNVPPFQEKEMLNQIRFNYDKNDEIHDLVLTFDNEEIIKNFREIENLKPGAPIEMEVKIGKDHSSFTITLKGNGKEVPVKFDFYQLKD